MGKLDNSISILEESREVKTQRGKLKLTRMMKVGIRPTDQITQHCLSLPRSLSLKERFGPFGSILIGIENVHILTALVESLASSV